LEKAITFKGGEFLSPNIKVTKKEDGAIISVDGFDITITVTSTKISPFEDKQVLESQVMNVESVKTLLAEFLEELDISENVEGIVVRPKSFLGRETFAAIAAIIKEIGGTYISAGKESRFLISKV